MLLQDSNVLEGLRYMYPSSCGDGAEGKGVPVIFLVRDGKQASLTFCSKAKEGQISNPSGAKSEARI